MTLRSHLCRISLSIRSSELSLLAVEIQTPYWPLSGKASNTDFEARPRDCLSVRDCCMVHGASHLRAIACNLGDLLCRECEAICTKITASTGSPCLTRQSEISRSGRHFAPSQFWSQALSSTYRQYRWCHTAPACASWSIWTQRPLFTSATTLLYGSGFLLSSILSKLTRSFAVKATKPRKPRSLSFALKSSNTATRMAVSFWTCLFQRCQL